MDIKFISKQEALEYLPMHKTEIIGLITEEEMEWLMSTDAWAVGRGSVIIIPKWMSMARAKELLALMETHD